jgi:hypothetical protein
VECGWNKRKGFHSPPQTQISKPFQWHSGFLTSGSIFSILISLGYIFIFAFSSWPCPAIKGTPTPHALPRTEHSTSLLHLFSHIQGSRAPQSRSHRTRSKATASKEEGGGEGEGGICSTCSLCSTTWKLLPARAASSSS